MTGGRSVKANSDWVFDCFHRKDEMDRCKGYGARVMTLEQLDGLKVIYSLSPHLP